MKKEPNLDDLKRLELSHFEKFQENDALIKNNQRLTQELEIRTAENTVLKATQSESEKINKTLISISNAVNTTVNLNDLYQFIHQALGQIIDSSNFIIAIHDSQNQTFSVPYYVDTMDAIPPLNMNNPQDIDSSVLTGTVLTEGRTLLIKKPEILKLMEAKKKRVFGTIAEIWLGVPLKIQNRIIGVMITQSYTDPNRYNERDVEFLTSVSEQVALAIERKRAVDALKQSEERYRTLVNNLDDIFFSVDAAGRFIYLSDQFESITGYGVNEINRRRVTLTGSDILPIDEADGEVYFDRLIHPEDQKTVLETLHQALQNGSTYRVEYRIIKKNGRVNWVYEKGSSLENPVNGKWLEGFIQDIHESRHAEEVNRVLFGISNAVHTTVDLNDLYKSIHYSLSRIVDVTNFFISLYDKKTDSLHLPYSVDALDDLTPDMYHISSPESNSHTAIVIKTGKPVLHTKEDFQNYLLERNLKPAMTLSKIWLGVPLKIKEEVIGAIVVHSHTNPNLYEEKDVNILLTVSEQVALAIERKRVNEALKLSEEKYRTILESITDGYYETDPAGNLVFCNEAMSRILGYDEKELIGLNNRRYMDEVNTRKVYAAFSRMFQTGKPINRFDFEVITKEGKKRDIDASASLIVDEKNKPVGFRGIARDITEQKIAEKEKKTLENQLQRAQKMEAIGMLAGGVAHDLNNILAGLVSYPELLLMDLPDDSPLRRPIQTIQRAGEKAAAIVQDLLTLARRGVALAEVVNINDVITEYLRSPVFGLLQSYHP
ncbi:MAG: PAS domain S-box protein, partial [Desulfobacteraceae bacterium]